MDIQVVLYQVCTCQKLVKPLVADLFGEVPVICYIVVIIDPSGS